MRTAAREEVREALALAIDREAIADKVTQGSFLPAYSWVPPGTPDYATQYVSFKDMPMAERVAKAKELLAGAGFSSGQAAEAGDPLQHQREPQEDRDRDPGHVEAGRRRCHAE